MLTERAELQIRPGQEDGFAAAMQSQGLALLKSVPGVVSARMGRGVEHPSKFMLLVEWETMDAHAAFNKSSACLELRALIGRFSQGGAMEHFQMG